MSPSPGRDVTVAEGSAPGKVILFGEHAVVHGKLCVAASLGLRTTCRLKFGEGAQGDDTGEAHPAPAQAPDTAPGAPTGTSHWGRGTGTSAGSTVDTGAGASAGNGATEVSTDTEAVVSLYSPSLGMSFSAPLGLLLTEIRACPTLKSSLLEPLNPTQGTVAAPTGTPAVHHRQGGDADGNGASEPSALVGLAVPVACPPEAQGQLKELVLRLFHRSARDGDASAPLGGTEGGGDGERDQGEGGERERGGGEGGYSVPETHVMSAAVFLYLLLKIVGPRPVSAVVTSELPASAGLGSSASFCVAVSAALLAAASGATAAHRSSPDLGQQAPASGEQAAAGASGKRSSGVGEGFGGRAGEDVECRGQEVEEEMRALVNAWALEGERIIHGTPSGVDNEVSSRGGILRFQAGKSSPLGCSLPLRILLSHTRVPRNTRSLVAGVGDLKARLPTVTHALLQGIDAVAHRAVEVLRTGSPPKDGGQEAPLKEGGARETNCNCATNTNTNTGTNTDTSANRTTDSSTAANTDTGSTRDPSESLPSAALDSDSSRARGGGNPGDEGWPEWARELDELVRLNQGLLACLGVSHPRIEKVCHTSWTAGGVHSKLTGAGGGGCVLTLLPPGIEGSKVKAIKELLEADGYDTFEAAVGCPGVAMRAGV